VTGIEPTTSGLLDQRRSCSDNQAPCNLVAMVTKHSTLDLLTLIVFWIFWFIFLKVELLKVKAMTPLENLVDKMVKARNIGKDFIEILPDMENKSNDRYVSFWH